MEDISVGFEVEASKEEYVYCGVWYKPWTWFRWEKVTKIEEVAMFDYWFINRGKGLELTDEDLEYLTHTRK